MKKVKFLLSFCLSFSLFFCCEEKFFATEKEKSMDFVLPIEPRGLDTHHYTIPIEFNSNFKDKVKAAEKFIVYKILEKKFFHDIFCPFEKKFRTYIGSIPLTTGYIENLKREEIILKKNYEKYVDLGDDFCSDGVDVFIEDRQSLKAIQKFLRNEQIKYLFESFKKNLKIEDIKPIYKKIGKEIKESNNTKNDLNDKKQDMKIFKEKLEQHIAIKNKEIEIDEKIKEIIKKNQNNKIFLKKFKNLYSNLSKNELIEYKNNMRKASEIYHKIDLRRILKIIKSTKYKSSLIERKIYYKDYDFNYYESAIISFYIIKILNYDKNKIESMIKYYKEKLKKTKEEIKKDENFQFNKGIMEHIKNIYKKDNIITKNIKKEEMKKIAKDLFYKEIAYEEKKELKNELIYYENIILELEKYLNEKSKNLN